MNKKRYTSEQIESVIFRGTKKNGIGISIASLIACVIMIVIQTIFLNELIEISIDLAILYTISYTLLVWVSFYVGKLHERIKLIHFLREEKK